MQLDFAMHKSSLSACLIVLLLAACTSDYSLSPFTTDGCSLFLDRSPFGEADWCYCCVAHDLLYWRGGTEEARFNADSELELCIRNASGSTLLAKIMFAGARIGGSPYLPTWFRWGYGWQFGRPYGPLTSQEVILASSLEREYRANNPILACPNRTHVSE